MTARVVHDRVTERGRLVEDTLDWYAQDAEGNVWYLGEDTTEYERGRPVSKAGSWEAGARRRARRASSCRRIPRSGRSTAQEFRAGEAEDRAKVLSLDEWVAGAARALPRRAHDEGLHAGSSRTCSSTSSTPAASGPSSPSTSPAARAARSWSSATRR